MQIEKQVCSLEYAKKLKELGVKQDSLFYYVYVNHGDYWELDAGANEYHHFPLNEEYDVSAFTVAELGEGIGIEIIISGGGDLGWTCACEELKVACSDENLANALAKLCIYLLENGLVEVNN